MPLLVSTELAIFWICPLFFNAAVYPPWPFINAKRKCRCAFRRQENCWKSRRLRTQTKHMEQQKNLMNKQTQTIPLHVLALLDPNCNWRNMFNVLLRFPWQRWFLISGDRRNVPLRILTQWNWPGVKIIKNIKQTRIEQKNKDMNINNQEYQITIACSLLFFIGTAIPVIRPLSFYDSIDCAKSSQTATAGLIAPSGDMKRVGDQTNQKHKRNQSEKNMEMTLGNQEHQHIISFTCVS